MKTKPSDFNQRENRDLPQSGINFQVLWETMIQGVVYHDAEGRIIAMNPAAGRILGMDPQDFLGKTSLPVEHTAIREDGSPFPWPEHPAMVALRTGKKQHNVVMGIYNPLEKAYRWININAVPLFRKGEKQPYQVYTVFDDFTERKRMSEELLKAKEELEAKVKERTTELMESNLELQLRATILDKATDAIFLRDMDYNFVYANEAACATYGYSKDEFLKMNFRVIIPPQEILYYEEMLQDVLEKGEINVPGSHRRKDGSIVPVEVHSHRIKIGEREYILSVIRDITRRLQAAKMVRESEEKYRLLVENANEGVAVAQDGFFKYCNTKITEITGYPQTELLVKPLPELVHTDDREMVTERYQNRIKGEDVLSQYDFRIVRKDGGIRWVKINAVKITWEGRPAALHLITDISSQKQAEDALRDSETKFRTLMEQSPDAIMLIDEEGRIIEYNRGSEVLFGLDRKETIGEFIWDVQYSLMLPERRTPEMYQRLKESAISALQTGESTFLNRPMEAAFQLPDGSRKTFRQILFSIRSEKGFRIGSISHDITEQRRMSDEIKQFARRLIEVQEEERKRISRDLHDETAQYLALLTLEIDSLITDKANPARLVARLQKLKETANKSIQEVRRYSHELRPSVLEHFGLPEALDLIINEFNERDSIDVDFKVIGEERRLKEEVELALFRITQEALSNIRKHSQASKARVTLRFAMDKINLTITDNGKGFQISKQSTVTPYGGLGLVGMRERAELIGAALKITSRIGAGTRITVEVPSPLKSI